MLFVWKPKRLFFVPSPDFGLATIAAQVKSPAKAGGLEPPWTVKGNAPEERNAAIAAAEREGLTIGEWLTRATRTQVQADHRSDRLPVALDPPPSAPSDR